MLESHGIFPFKKNLQEHGTCFERQPQTLPVSSTSMCEVCICYTACCVHQAHFRNQKVMATNLCQGQEALDLGGKTSKSLKI